MSYSNYAENKILDHMLGTASWTAPTNVYFKLHTGDPGEDGTANASAETTRKVATFSVASGGSAALSAAVEWASWTAGTETITHVSLWDDLTAGNCLGSGALAASKLVANGDNFRLTTSTVVTLD